MTNKEKIKELEAVNMKLRVDNLHMRLEIEIMTERPQGLAAKKIRRKYRHRQTEGLPGRGNQPIS